MNVGNVGAVAQYSPVAQSLRAQSVQPAASASEELAESPAQRAQENEAVGGSINTYA